MTADVQKSEARTTMTLCLGSSCFTRGNNDHLPRLQQALSDRGLEDRVHLKGSRCEGRCLNGPILCIGDTVIEHLDADRIEAALERHL